MSEVQRQAIARDLARRLQLAGIDELRVIDRVLGRLELGRERYGGLDLSKPRDWRRERFEERLDALVYDVCDELVLEDAARAQLREEARVERLENVTPAGRADAIIEAAQIGAIDAETAREWLGEATRTSDRPARIALDESAEPYEVIELGGKGG